MKNDKREITGWAMYDWANSAFSVTVVTTFLGPYLSVYVSIVAIRHAEAGVAQVLLGAVPIFVMGPAWLVYRDRPSPLALLGVVVAVAGGALLFLR